MDSGCSSGREDEFPRADKIGTGASRVIRKPKAMHAEDAMIGKNHTAGFCGRRKRVASERGEILAN